MRILVNPIIGDELKEIVLLIVWKEGQQFLLMAVSLAIESLNKTIF
jgi:hypothetical protein